MKKPAVAGLNANPDQIFPYDRPAIERNTFYVGDAINILRSLDEG